jgi:hypothetical protein
LNVSASAESHYGDSLLSSASHTIQKLQFVTFLIVTVVSRMLTGTL